MTIVLADVIEEAKLELAERSHTPTPAMVSTAKRGLRKAKDRKNIDPTALAVGRKIASGQKLSSDHVEHMAAYNAALDSPPVGDSDDEVEHMLWAGAPGASWANSRVMAMDSSELAEHPVPTILELAQEGKDVSLEVFVRDQLAEPTTIDADQGLIWAPILRSGMIATRPGPNGEKLNEPLVFVPGKASDPRKEIGLQNLMDNFNAGAVQHVTIPTKHENDVLSNTGFIKGLKIVDSKKFPGEKVLAAGHDFRDPDVRRKVELGTIANRSCGIVYDYTNTGTGTKFDQVLDHVALTNRPWVTGMAAYGEIESEDDFGDREIVPMLLSERPATHLASSVSDSAWDGSPARFTDAQYAKSCILDRGKEAGAAKIRYSLPIRDPDGTLNRAAVHSAAGRIAGVKGASLAQKKSAARALISAYGKLDEDAPDGLRKLVASSTNMSEAERKALNLADVQWGPTILSMNKVIDQVTEELASFTVPDEIFPIWSVMDVATAPDPQVLVRVDYGDPGGVDDAWVIPLEVDGDKVTLSDFAQWTPVQKEWVTDEDGNQDKQEVSSILGLSENTNVILPPTLKGGAMPPTTQEALERLGLSEDQLAVLKPLFSENQNLKTQLGEVTKKSREDAVKNRVQELQSQKFPPGFCKAYEEIALGDDGMVAATLNLSDDNGAQTGEREYTVTEVAERLIKSLPHDDSGALALSDRGNLLASPISTRPPLTAADQAAQEEKDGGKRYNADDMLAEMEKAAPGITAQYGLQLSDDEKKGN